MNYKKVIGLVVAIVCAMASLWIGAWLLGSVFTYSDWQHFPTAFTSFIVFWASAACTVKILINWAKA